MRARRSTGRGRQGRQGGADLSGLLLLLELPLVEGELLALEHVAVAAPALPRPRGDAGEEPAALELLLDHGVQLLLGLARLELEDDVAALLLLLLCLLLSALLAALLALLAEVDPVLLQVPLLVRLRIDLHNRVLRQSLRPHQLVARGIVDDIQDTDLLRAILGAPREVAVVDAQSSVLHVAAAAANGPNTLGAELAQGGGPAHLELALLLVDVPAAAGVAVLVAGVARDPHGDGVKLAGAEVGSPGEG